jgi:TetR/AcrR family tetracycline transcriptional repressor
VAEPRTPSRRSPAGRQAGLDKATVVAAALRLLDAEGLEKLTLRRLAQDLDVAAPALYWHFRDKRELLDGMVAAIADELGGWPEPGPDDVWDEWLADRFRQQRRTLLNHRDSARLVAGTRPTSEALPMIEREVGIGVRFGLTAGQALRAILVVSNYVTGFVLDEQAEAAREAAEAGQEMSASERMFREKYASGQIPNLAAAFDEVGDPNSEAGFEFGLQLLIDGLRIQIERNRAAPAAAVGNGEGRHPADG